MSANDPSEATITYTLQLGRYGIAPVMPTVTHFVGAVTVQYASTFDYKASFQCGKHGYTNNAPDLAGIELWAADHGQTDYFYCGKIAAQSIPMSQGIGSASGLYPTYTGIWKGLGEGRAYDLYILYRLTDGSGSQYSAAVITNLKNAGMGSGAFAQGPTVGTIAPVVLSSNYVASLNPAGSTVPYGFDGSITFTLDYSMLAATAWINSVVVFVVPHTYPTPDTNAAPTTRVVFKASGSYSANLRGIPFLRTGVGGYDIYVAYQDQARAVQSPTLLPGAHISNTISEQTVYINSLVSLDLGGVPVTKGAGAPASTPATKPALYFRSDGGAGTSMYVWNGTAWTAIA